MEKYFFGQTEMEYLGFSVIRNGICKVNKGRSYSKYGAINN